MPASSAALALRRSAQLAAKSIVKEVEVVVEEPPPHIIKARESFSHFCKLMGKPPARHMREWHKVFVTGQSNDHLQDIAGPNTCLLSPRGPLDPETEVATPSGWRQLKDLVVGDQVFAVDGTPTQVVDVVDYESSPCWRVLCSDGTSVICDDSHRWEVRMVGVDPEGTWRVTTLEALRTLKHVESTAKGLSWMEPEMVPADPGEKPWINHLGAPRYQVPICAAVEYPEQVLPIDPYLLGVLLGKGSRKGPERINLNLAEPGVVEACGRLLPPGCQLELPRGSRKNWGITSKPGASGAANHLEAALEELGLGTLDREQRFIPEIYQRGSIQQRLALFHGLMDATGIRQPGPGDHEGQGYARLRITTHALPLFKGFRELVRSLGGITNEGASSRLPPPEPLAHKSFTGPYYSCGVRLPDGTWPFLHSYKTHLYLGPASGHAGSGLTRWIVEIEPVEARPVRCISIEHSSELFLTRSYLPVKNSAKSTVLGLLLGWLIGRHALSKRLLRILYVSYNVDVARNKSAAIKNLICSKEYQEVFPCVRLSKTRTSDELWSIDWDLAEIDVRGEDAFTIACAGLKGTITSKRSSLIVVDDAIKSAASIANPDIRREMETNWTNVIVPTMFQGARAIALGTRFHFDDLFATIFTERKGWKVLTQSALCYDEDGKPRSYWPEMWSIKYLMKLQQDDRIAFSYQYLNQPVRSTELGVSPELFVRGEVPDVYDTVGVGIDLSAGMTERNDWTVFTLAGRVDDKVYVIDYRRMRSMGNIEKIEALCELLLEWNLLATNDAGQYFPTNSPVTIWPEVVAYQKSFEGDLKRVLFNEWGLHNLNVSPVKGFRGDKLARLRGILGLFQTKKIIFNKYRDFGYMIDEIVNFGHSPHDDCADSLNIVVQGLMRRGAAHVEWN